MKKCLNIETFAKPRRKIQKFREKMSEHISAQIDAMETQDILGTKYFRNYFLR